MTSDRSKERETVGMRFQRSTCVNIMGVYGLVLRVVNGDEELGFLGYVALSLG